MAPASLRCAVITKGNSMQRITFLLCAVSLAWSAAANAQAPAPAAGDTAVPEAAKPAAAYKFVEPRVITDYPSPSKADPRVCLEFPTQQQIIACANKYLPRRKS